MKVVDLSLGAAAAGGMRKRMQDYLTVFQMISPFFSGSPVTTAAEYCRFVRHVQVGIYCKVTGSSTRISERWLSRLISASQRLSFSVQVKVVHCLHLTL